MHASVRPAPRGWRWLHAAAVSVVVLLGAACYADLPTYSAHGVLTVNVLTTGDDTDVDGYSIVVDGRPMGTIGASSKSGSFYLQSGSHVISIADVAPNCSLTGPTTLQAEVSQDQAVTVSYTIACVGTGVRITTATTGPDGPVAFRAAVGQQPAVAVAVNGTHTIGRISPGTHSVTLTVPEHCSVEGSNPLSVVVLDKGYADAGFTVVCSPAIRREKIAYVVGELTSRIETITPDGSGIEQLDERGSSVAWKRDGTQLVVSDAACGYDYYYYQLGPCSGGVYLLDPELGMVTRFPAAEGGYRPAWSPVRDELAFDREIPGGGGEHTSQLFVLDARDQAAQAILAGSPMMRDATWAPDGERIAYVCALEPSKSDLCVVNRDGSGFKRLTTDEAANLDPAWSPDGKTIAFRYIAAGGTPTGNVALLDIASGALTVLGPGFDPAWSPDGSRLVFATADGLFLMNSDGSNRRRLTTGSHLSPAWRPIR